MSEPPFAALPPADSDSQSNHDETQFLLPASCRNDKHKFWKPKESGISEFLLEDLSVARLNKIHGLLWLVGKPYPPRPLSFQLAIERVIVLDERADMHLVWEKSRRLHLKPLPEYLLDYQFWVKHICSSKSDQAIYDNALGFLHSYLALIQRRSDFKIAQGHHLIPETLGWEDWVTFVERLLVNGKINERENFNRRYKYGELRLSRLNHIYRYQQLKWPRGYEFRFQTYNELFQAYIAPITVTTVYVVLTLTAMQVGLATDKLRESVHFQRASYGTAVFAILSPLLLLLPVAMMIIFIFVVNLAKTLRSKKERLNPSNERGSYNMNQLPPQQRNLP